MGAIEIDELVKHYGSVVGVDGITFEVNEGELVSLLGPSGCGKSTTLRSIAGLERITDGEIRITGRVCSGWCSSPSRCGRT
jgi:ABC-type sugar transport system ATPase subunit